MNEEEKYLEEQFNLALKYYHEGNFKDSEKIFYKILEKRPDHFSTIFILGTIAAQTKNYSRAIRLLEKSKKIKSNYSPVYNNLGNVFLETGDYKKAKENYKRAVGIDHKHSDAHYNLGVVLNKLNKKYDAIESYKKAINLDPKFVKAYNNLGNVLEEIGEKKAAISSYENAIKINPKYTISFNGLGVVYRGMGNTKKALYNFKKALQIEPNNLTSHWLSMNTFPIVYQNTQEVDFYEKRFEEWVNKIDSLLKKEDQFTKKQIIDALTSSTNFYLHYQGRNTLRLQKKYAGLIEKLTKIIYPQFHKKIKKTKKSKHVKVGFVSSYFRSHSITSTHKNFILKLNKANFKSYVYYAGNQFDKITKEIKKASHSFFSHTDVDQLINQISKDDLDILVYLEIGMNPKMHILGSLRLAPKQCSGLGHPVSSGLKNIDYVLTGKLMEPNNAKRHYSEKIIFLPNSGQNYEKPKIIQTIQKNNKQNNKIIFFNFQSLFKLLPEDDLVFLKIIKKNPSAKIWFMEGKNQLITNIFKQRIDRLFKENNMSYKKYFVFHPMCKQKDFFKLINKSDVVLDSLGWSGNNTSHQAITLNKPIVTLPGDFMRGRHTYSILKMLNIEETIAKTKTDYVNIATKLATDVNFRKQVINKIKKNKNKVFNDEGPTIFLESFYKKIV